MNKLNLIIAGAAMACATQFATAENTPMAAPTVVASDQSQVQLKKDPYIKKRVTSKEARDEYLAKKDAAKKEYKEEKSAAKAERKATNKEAAQERKEELKTMAK